MNAEQKERGQRLYTELRAAHKAFKAQQILVRMKPQDLARTEVLVQRMDEMSKIKEQLNALLKETEND